MHNIQLIGWPCIKYRILTERSQVRAARPDRNLNLSTLSAANICLEHYSSQVVLLGKVISGDLSGLEL